MQLQLEDTIVAIASPPNPSDRGIIRISGQQTQSCVNCFTHDLPQLRRPERVAAKLNIQGLTNPLDAWLMVWPNSRSYTGEPMVEIHTVGSPPMLDAVMQTVIRSGARAAHRGEFTMRAFLAGRIDLVQAEAVLGVIDASDQVELQQALSQLGGGMTAKLRHVRDTMISLLGDLEAGLDFVEEDIEFVSNDVIRSRLDACHSVISKLVDAAKNRLPSGFRPTIVLAGLPNVGKSSLFNRLTTEGSAIVSNYAGTTRDYLQGEFAYGSTVANLIDTAGQESDQVNIALMAQRRTAGQIQQADLVVWCSASNLSTQDQALDENLFHEAQQSSSEIIRITTLCDLIDHPNNDNCVTKNGRTNHSEQLSVSAKTGFGLDDLRNLLVQSLLGPSTARNELLGSTAVRCQESLQATKRAIESAIDAACDHAGDEIIAMELRDALHQLGIIIGETYSDDVLGHIFSNFCIGK